MIQSPMTPRLSSSKRHSIFRTVALVEACTGYDSSYLAGIFDGLNFPCDPRNCQQTRMEPTASLPPPRVFLLGLILLQIIYFTLDHDLPTLSIAWVPARLTVLYLDDSLPFAPTIWLANPRCLRLICILSSVSTLIRPTARDHRHLFPKEERSPT